MPVDYRWAFLIGRLMVSEINRKRWRRYMLHLRRLRFLQRIFEHHGITRTAEFTVAAQEVQAVRVLRLGVNALARKASQRVTINLTTSRAIEKAKKATDIDFH